MPKPQRPASRSLDELGVPRDAALPRGASYAHQRPSSIEAELLATFSDPALKDCLRQELSAPSRPRGPKPAPQ